MSKKKEGGKKGGGKSKGPTAEQKVQELMARLREEAKLSIFSTQLMNYKMMKVQRKELGKDLRKDIELSQVSFDKVLLIKNKIIQSLAEDLNNSMEQAKQAQDSHQEFLKKLQDLQLIRLATLDQLWRGGQEELSAEFNYERDEMLVQHREEIDYLKDVSEVMHNRDFDMRFDAKLNYQSLTNALQRLQITKNDLADKHILEQQKKDERDDLKPDEHAYEKAEAEFKVALKAMEARCCTKSILIQGRKLQKLQTTRDEMVEQAGTGEHSNRRELQTAEKRASVKSMAMKATRIKSRMSRERTAARSRLTRLVMNTSSAEKRLRDTRTKGERLLFRAQMCAKEQAKDVRSSASKEALAPPAVPPPKEIAEAMAEYQELEPFWLRYNKVRLEQLYLKRQEIALKRENKYLHAVLRHCTPFF